MMRPDSEQRYAHCRKIVHLDMDAFFASVEQRDHPELRGKPVIVGGSAERRGVVSTCSYEARAFGVHSAMPAGQARRLCPQGVFIEGNMRKYREASHEVFSIFAEYTDLIEPLSIDEAFLDVTRNFKGHTRAVELTWELQNAIRERTGLSASAGVSYNKFLAKIASDMRKPAGLTLIRPDQAKAFLDALPIGKFYGIGPATADKLRRMNIKTGRELRLLDLATLTAHFGKSGAFYYSIVRGVDDRPVEPDSERKSVGRETTLAADTSDVRFMRVTLRSLARKVEGSLKRHQLAGRTVTLKIRYEDFKTHTRSCALEAPSDDGAAIGRLAVELLAKTDAFHKKVRLLGVTVSNFPAPDEASRPVQLVFDF